VRLARVDLQVLVVPCDLACGEQHVDPMLPRGCSTRIQAMNLSNNIFSPKTSSNRFFKGVYVDAVP